MTAANTKGFFIPVYNGILEHCRKMGDAIWLFLWLIDHTTKEEHDKGKVLGGMPIRDRDIARSLGGVSVKTIRRWRSALTLSPYIEATNTGHGFSYTVLKSKKRSKKTSQSGQKCLTRVDKNVHSELPEPATLYRQEQRQEQ